MSEEATDDYDYYDETGLVNCPHCNGLGDVPCYCGGDLCVCDNYGYETCRVCGGEGEVTEERYDRYEENQRKNAALLREAFAKSKPAP